MRGLGLYWSIGLVDLIRLRRNDCKQITFRRRSGLVTRTCRYNRLLCLRRVINCQVEFLRLFIFQRFNPDEGHSSLSYVAFIAFPHQPVLWLTCDRANGLLVPSAYGPANITLEGQRFSHNLSGGAGHFTFCLVFLKLSEYRGFLAGRA